MLGLEFINNETNLSLAMSSQYDYLVVLGSYIVAWIGAYAGLSTVPAIRLVETNKARIAWKLTGAIAMGAAIWSMHFVGMLALYLPVNVEHHVGLTTLSIVPAIIASYFALFFIERDHYQRSHLVYAGVLLGAGIGTMHYIGMEAMQGEFTLVYEPVTFLLSILVAVILAIFALSAGQFKRHAQEKGSRRLITSAALVGAAITGMHYMGMQASYFLAINSEAIVDHTGHGSTHGAMLLILIISTVLLSTLAVVSTIIYKMFIKLNMAKNEAESSAIAKSEFLASMSHEIRTPMNGVLGMLDLLVKTDLNDDQQYKAKIAHSSAKSLLSLINDILDFSKIDAGKLDLELLHFDLRSMLVECADTLALKAEEKGLELILDVTHIEHSMVKGDPSRIRQIITNLVSNAIKFTDIGSVTIRAKLKESEDNKLILSCSVDDNGIGISSDAQSKLFQMFTQVDSSTTRKYGGTGLGLSIVKQLCQLMNGDVSVTSILGEGSCFKFYISLSSSEQSKHIVPSIDVSKLSLLVIDDNPINREVLRGQLEHWGGNVTEASCAASTLKILKEQVGQQKKLFDIAFVDMQMPIMDGADLAIKIRALSEYDSMSLVMMTSMMQKDDKEFFAKLGFCGYFSKPVASADVLDTIAVIQNKAELSEKNSPLITSQYLATLSHDENKVDEPKEAVDKPKKVETASFVDHEPWPEHTKILLVEDNRINIVVATMKLKEMGLSAEIACNGEEALSILKSSSGDTPFTLILMDCQMPMMDGYETTKQIRSGKAGECYPNIPIIAMTANAMKGDKEKCLNSGMNDYLPKPINSEELKRLLKQWLECTKEVV